MYGKFLIKHYLKRAIIDAAVILVISLALFNSAAKDARLQRQLNGEFQELLPEAVNDVDGEIIININTASAHQLQRLSGIGEEKALSIVEYREENGYFSAPEEIMKVRGIGERIFENIRGNITV